MGLLSKQQVSSIGEIYLKQQSPTTCQQYRQRSSPPKKKSLHIRRGVVRRPLEFATLESSLMDHKKRICLQMRLNNMLFCQQENQHVASFFSGPDLRSTFLSGAFETIQPGRF